jgi:tetratricopeptide (TPR) repeat protein
MTSVIGVLLVLLAQAPAAGPPADNSDFPRADRIAWELQRKGLTAKAAARSLRTAPDAVETFALLVAADRPNTALQVLRRIVDEHPERMAQAFHVVSSTPGGRLHDDSQDCYQELQRLVQAGFTRLPALDREEAARAERSLMSVDVRHIPGWTYGERLRTFVEKYKGTHEATLVELEMVSSQLDRAPLESFIRDHSGDPFGARALYEQARWLSNNGPSTREPETDPTERFMKVLGAVRELQDGPPSEWAQRAPSLIAHFRWDRPFAPANLTLVVDTLYTFVTTNGGAFTPNASGGPEDLLLGPMATLFEQSGQGVTGIERTLQRLEGDTGDRAMATYLRAVLCLSSLDSRGYSYRARKSRLTDDERALRIRGAIESLDALSRTENRYTRWALATLATFHLDQQDFTRARARYQEYLHRFPTSDYAWLAALRAGETAERAGDLDAALDAYRTASRPGGGVLPVVLGHVAAARIHESAARYERALAEYRRAAAAWDTDYGREYSVSGWTADSGRVPPGFDTHLDVSQLALRERVRRLKIAITSPAAARLEHGRWLLEHGRWADARLEFEAVLSRYPASPTVGDARSGTHVAALREALASLSKPEAAAAALQELERISAEPSDFAVSAAKIARATLLHTQGSAAEANALMASALQERLAQTHARAPVRSRSRLEDDVVGIRRVIFTPASKRPYMLAASELDVTLPDGEQRRVSSELPFPGHDNVIFVDRRELDLLHAVLDAFPDQGWWDKFFEAGPATWGFVPLQTHPDIWRLDFVNAARTRATAQVSTSAATGRAIVVEKVRGVWRIVRTGGEWIS